LDGSKRGSRRHKWLCGEERREERRGEGDKTEKEKEKGKGEKEEETPFLLKLTAESRLPVEHRDISLTIPW